MTPMCDSTTLEHVGWAVGITDCDGVIVIEYFDVDGVSEGATLPTDWQPCVQGEAGPAWEPTQSALSYTTPTDIDFGDDEWFRVIDIGGNLTLSGSNYQSAVELTILIREAGGAPRTLTFPTDWVWLTTKPTTIAANKDAILKLNSFGTAATDVYARYWVAV